MLRRFTPDEPTPIDDQIAKVLDEMQKEGPTSEKYSTLLTLFERLTELKQKNSRSPVSRDTVAIIVGNLFGIFAILAFEKTHVITTKALALLLRPK